MAQRHSVVIPRADGGVEVHPLKEWLRQNPETLPGLDPSSVTSHQLRAALRRQGWAMQETPAEVRLVKPGTEMSSELIGEILGPGGTAEEVRDDGEGALPFFSLEYQLRDFIASNIGTISIDGRRLQLYVDPAGRDGVEYPSGVGPIDILAVDETGTFYVFELKRANSSDRAFGQVARYMGWINKTIGRGRESLGVIVAKSISENLRFAASTTPNVRLFEYEVAFALRPAHELE